MTDHILVEDSYIQSLIEGAAWDLAKVPLGEKKDSGQKKGDKGKDKDDPKAKDFEDGGDRKGDKGAKGKKGDKPDFTTGARKGDKSKTHKGKDFEDDDEDRADECKAGGSTYDKPSTRTNIVTKADKEGSKKLHQAQVAKGKPTNGDDSDDKNEAVEVHMCPLCETVLEEALTDEQVQEHLEQIQEWMRVDEQDDEDEDADEMEEQSSDPDDPANKEKVARVAGGESDYDSEGLDSKKRTGPVDPDAAKAHALAKKGQADAVKKGKLNAAKKKVAEKVKTLKASAKGS